MINIFKLKEDSTRDEFANFLGLNELSELVHLANDDPEKFKMKMLMFLDMFEFWHTALKEV